MELLLNGALKNAALRIGINVIRAADDEVVGLAAGTLTCGATPQEGSEDDRRFFESYLQKLSQ